MNITETETATRMFESRDKAWQWLENHFGANGGTVSIGAFFFERVKPEEPLTNGTVFNITGSRGTKRQARLDVWEPHDGRAMLTFLDSDNQVRRSHKYTIVSDDKGNSCQLKVEIRFYRSLGFFSLLVYLISVLGSRNRLAKYDLGLQ